jgi:ribosomal protein S18 acetylase RimI-like enzyme
MHDLSLRPATSEDVAFALEVTEACMRVYAEQTWGSWNGLADFDSACDQIVELADKPIGLMGVERLNDHWFIDKLYLMPAFQNRGIGSALLSQLKSDATQAHANLGLSVLEVNPARRFYQRHGFVVTHTVPPRVYMEWTF